MTEITRNFQVVRKHGFEAKMAELTRRYKVEFKVVWGEAFNESVEVARDEFIRVWFHPCTVTFSFEEFKIDGYTYLGNILDNDMIGLITIHGNDLTEGLDLSSWVKSFDGIPCHACNRRHVRKIGHVFMKDDTQELQVYGSGCAKKYFGINFDRVLSFFQNLGKRYDDWADMEFRTYVAYRVDSFVAIKDAYYCIAKYGYTSKSRAEHESDSTAWAVDSITDASREKLPDYEITTASIDPSVVWEKSYTKDPENKTDFEHNIEVIQEKLKFHLCGPKDFGWIAFMVYNEWFKPAPVEKVEYELPEGVEVGDKIREKVVTFTSIKSFDNEWGRTYINELVCDNVRYKWFSSVSVAHKFEGIEFGKELFLKIGTVKKIEDDPKWGKSVILTRASLYEI